jgi:beta-glucanase (GH16 family)
MSPSSYPFSAGPFANSQPKKYPNNVHRPPAQSQSSTSLISPASSSTTSLLSPVSRISPTFAKGPPSLRSTTSNSSLSESPYSISAAAGRTPSTNTSLSDKFSLSADPAAWGSDINPNHPEPDDYLHNPDPRRDRKNDNGGHVLTYRGLTNLGCLLFLGTVLIALFAGYPLLTYFTKHPLSTLGGFNIGGINATGQVPKMPGNWGLVDLDTPQSAYTYPSFADGSEWQLVFSDEFNTDGRTFYPGDDPYWEAVDLHYWATGNMEWYDPSAITTKNGSLHITLSANPEHGLNYTGGLLSTWNKLCFTGGMLVASVSLPGSNSVPGFWPALWTMGNLGRSGYGASLEGMWPYTYDSCDVGTVANQTLNGLPLAATVGGDPGIDGILSYLPGQRLSRCTCSGESHPGPMHSDGTYVGRAAPEIDVFEAQIQGGVPAVSQSAQWGPFNAGYEWFNTSQNLIIPNPEISVQNSYIGGRTQQATSVVTQTNLEAYELNGGLFEIYGFEYKPGNIHIVVKLRH